MTESIIKMTQPQRNQKVLDHKTDFKILNYAIESFNTTAQELEHSYKLLHDQVGKLNRELEEKNRQLEKNLHEKERAKNFLSSILESLPTGVVVTDLNGRFLMGNSAVEKITGTCPSRMNSRVFKEWLRKLQVADYPLKGAAKAGTGDVEFFKKNSDVRNLKVFQSCVVGTEGETIGALLIIQDQTRLKKLEIQSERDKRLKAMGEMAIKVAHEVRNPLGSIELFASILRRELDVQDDLKKMAERIITEVKRLNNSISNLLLFTRPQKPLLNEMDLSEFLEEFVEFIRPVVSKNNVELIYETAKPSFFIACDRDLLKQVFLNLTLNAMQAMTDKGCIKIGVHACKDEDGPNSKWVEITFSDDGVGIAPESVNKVFHPFYTTKDKGTGLGLAIVHNIIESQNGTIEARSRLNKGTSFLVSLPRISA